MLEGKKKRLGLLMILIVVVGTLGGILLIQRMVPSQNSLFWNISESYDTNGNETYSVIFNDINFTFLYTEETPLDVPIPVHFRVDFPDGTTEYIANTIGGLMMQPPRIVMSVHLKPQVAIVCSFGDSHEDWYSWYYAVSK
ncbi:MAG: hypothetical protein ACFFEJ_17435 [Candidatus Thorarchaeota archaeon]